METTYKINYEHVYDIDVYVFKNSNGLEYQLTFEQNLKCNLVNTRLVNLLASPNSLYCRDLRKTIKSIIYEYLLTNSCILFFDIKLNSYRKYILLSKLLRWIELEDKVRNSLKLNYKNGELFVEFYLSID